MSAFVALAQRRADLARLERGAYVRASVAARLLGLHVRTVHHWISRGWIAGKREKNGRWYVSRAALRSRLDEAERPDAAALGQGVGALVAGIVCDATSSDAS